MLVSPTKITIQHLPAPTYIDISRVLQELLKVILKNTIHLAPNLTSPPSSRVAVMGAMQMSAKQNFIETF